MRADVYTPACIRSTHSFYFPFLRANLKESNEIGDNEMNSTILNTQQAADYIGMSKAFLERDRWAGARIPFIKVGSRAVRYRQSDLDAFLDQQVRQSTSYQGAN